MATLLLIFCTVVSSIASESTLPFRNASSTHLLLQNSTRSTLLTERPLTNVSGGIATTSESLPHTGEITRIKTAANGTGQAWTASPGSSNIVELLNGMPKPPTIASQTVTTTRSNSTNTTPASRDYRMITDWVSLIAPIGSGGAYASSCEALSRSWSSVSTQWFFKNRVTTLVTSTETYNYSIYDSVTAEIVQTSCLGAQRELGGETLSISPLGMTTYYETYTYNMFTSNASYPAPRPTCSFGVSACNSLWDMHDDYINSVATIWPSEEYTSVPPIYKPVCEPDRPGKYCDSCTIGADQMQMYYWPPVAIGEPCDPDRRFTTATATIPGFPNTMVFGTNTFTSPTVYLSFYRLAARQTKISELYYCGRDFEDIIVPIQAESVSSIRWTRTDFGDYTETFTFEDNGITTTTEELARNFTLSAGQPR